MLTTISFKRIFIVTTPVCILVIILFILNTPLQTLSQNCRTKEDLFHCPQGNKRILFWTKFFEVDDFYIGFGNRPFQQCQVLNCCTTNNRSLLLQSDAVVFHIRDLDLGDMPPHRSSNQRWIFFLLESPLHTPNILGNLSNVFNWTMTYRLDSDIYAPYPVTEIDEIQQEPITESWNMTFYYHQGKTKILNKKKLVAWFVSNCITSSKREKYVTKLQNYLQVDIYGACGPLECLNHIECYEMMEHSYKFYLAFENSVCHDYVTEKFYNALFYKSVPIVYGGANYSAVAPPNSYIDVRNFSSVKILAEYLKYLDGNDSAYMRYFDWRKSSSVLSSLPHKLSSWCILCNMLNNSTLPKHSYANIHAWWFDQGQCEKDGTTIQHIIV